MHDRTDDNDAAKTAPIADLRSTLLELIQAAWTTQAIHAACELGLPDWLAGGPQTLNDLATASRCNAAALGRLLQGLVALGLCDRCGDGRFALAPLGEALRDDHPESLRAWALQVGGVQTPRWVELAESVRTGRGWRNRHEGQDGFDALADQPGVAATFHRAMNELTRRVAIEVLEVRSLGGRSRRRAFRSQHARDSERPRAHTRGVPSLVRRRRARLRRRDCDARRDVGDRRPA